MLVALLVVLAWLAVQTSTVAVWMLAGSCSGTNLSAEEFRAVYHDPSLAACAWRHVYYHSDASRDQRTLQLAATFDVHGLAEFEADRALYNRARGMTPTFDWPEIEARPREVHAPSWWHVDHTMTVFQWEARTPRLVIREVWAIDRGQGRLYLVETVAQPTPVWASIDD